jgi:UDP-N-acetylmuramyl pentapeptide phosphotransferase/UDP-N-acetylglucosamine-1-phosphate transferase
MDLAGAVLAGAGVSAAAAAGGAALVAWAGPLDAPRARSSHATPTVTSGGLAILAAAALGLAVFGQLAPEGRTDLARVALAFGFAGALGLLGALDDLFDLGARPKLLLQAAASAVFAGLVARIETLPLGFGLAADLGVVAGVLGTGLWLVVATNAVNFMDGANGLAGGCVAIALAALGAAGLIHGQPAVGAAALVAAAAIAGFLPWNLPARRLFQGDVGALFTGFLVAALAVVGATAQPDRALSVYLVPFALTPFLTDVLLTLAVRARRGRSLFEAHRDHLYQLWLTRTGGSHAALALRAWVITALYAGAGLASEWAPEGTRPLLFAAGVAVCAAAWTAARRRLELA